MDATILHFPILVLIHISTMLYIDPKMQKSKSPIKMDVCCFCFPKMQKMVTKKWSEHFTGSPMFRMAIRWLQQDLRRSNGANNSKQRIMSSGMKQLTCVKVRSKHWIVGKLNGKNKLETKPKLVKNIYKELVHNLHIGNRDPRASIQLLKIQTLNGFTG